MDAIEETSGGVRVTVWVTPNASRERIGGLHAGAIRVWVTAPAEDGRANDAVVASLAEKVGSKNARLVSGHTARRKVVEIDGINTADARRILLAGG